MTDIDATLAERTDGFQHMLSIVRVTSAIIVFLALVWSVAAFVLDQPVVLATSLATIAATVVANMLIWQGYTLTGRLIWFFMGIVVVTFGYFIVHPAGMVETMYVALLGGPFLTFSLYRERTYILVMVPSVFAIWLIVRQLGHDFFGPPIVGQDIAERFIAFFSLFTSFVIIMAEMSMFALLMHRYNERLRLSRRSATQANQAKSEFLAAMSHEIRTPMNGVIGMVEILEQTDLTSDQRRILQTIHDSSFSLLRIIEDILDMSKIEAGKLALVNERVKLLQIIEGTVDTLRSYADNNNVYLSLRFDMGLPETVTTDPGRLRQVLLNLLGNAIKFSRRPADEPRGHVRLWVRRDENDLLRLSVTDDGIGIDEDFQSHLFQPFRQSEAVTNRRYGGSGLGLAIVHQLVTKMNGIVTVRSKLGEGSEFTVCLPLLAAEGTQRVPDVKGTTFRIYASTEWQRTVWTEYLAVCGGMTDFISRKEDLWTCAKQNSHDVFILAMNQSSWAEREAMVADFRKDFPDTRMIVLSRTRSDATGLLRNGMVMVQAGPLLPSDLWTALRSLTKPNEVMKPEVTRSPVSATPRRKTRILVAEDNEINQIVIKRQIEQLGHESVIVENGRLAVGKWLEGGFDMILTDCHMPEMDGFALTRHIRDLEAARDGSRTPIIAVTANALAGEAERCLEAGMDGYLSKPVKLSDFEEMIDRMTGRLNAA